MQLLQNQGFQVFKTVGQGAFGLVFLVASTETGLMAAKVMQSQVFDPIEWDAAGRLQEGDPIPFIIQFKFARQFDDLVVILMEFANLKSLDHIIKRNYDLSGGTVRAIAKQLFEGLKLIHAKGLVHRDIRGENILMHCPPGSQRVIVKIADFGLVKIQNLIQRTMLMSAKGTPLNMAPELVIGDRKADSKVDIWSVGVVLYQLVAHQYPIKATSVPELQTLMRQNKTINRPSLIRDNLFWDLLLNLLQFDRTKRFSADQALQHPYFTSEQAQNEIKRRYQYQLV
ncbi:MAG: putative serine/threonine protein kinase [Streblomastix strix]|uniref:Putative serine/threonine protein kinase n=1 Tax=Streblomastix strix TaxID=222440 RepID=A0A5J4WXQ3_9EUKA|nr:MAG: putative serine/threonine protein kinase [Streblomastix strix]